MAKKTNATDNVEENFDGLSKEELETKRAEVTAYYEDHIPSLKIQLEYEALLRDIEKTRAERLQAQMFIANTMAGPPGSDGKTTSQISKDASAQQTVSETVQRTLKREPNATK